MNTTADRIEIRCYCTVCKGRGTMGQSEHYNKMTAKKQAVLAHNLVAFAWSPLGRNSVKIEAK